MWRSIKTCYYKNLDLTLFLIKKPKKNLNQDKDVLVEEISELARSSWEEYEKEKIENIFLGLDHIILGRIEGELCFVTGGRWEPLYYRKNKVPVYRIGLTIVGKFNKKGECLRRKGILSKGISVLLGNVFLMRPFSSFYLTFRTLDPIIYKFAFKNLDYILPDCQGYSRPNDKEKNIALQVSKNIDPACEFDQDKFVTKRAYRGNLRLAEKKLEELELFLDEEVKLFFEKNINYQQGDAFIILAKVNLYSFLKYRFRKLFSKILKY